MSTLIVLYRCLTMGIRPGGRHITPSPLASISATRCITPRSPSSGSGSSARPSSAFLRTTGPAPASQEKSLCRRRRTPRGSLRRGSAGLDPRQANHLGRPTQSPKGPAVGQHDNRGSPGARRSRSLAPGSNARPPRSKIAPLVRRDQTNVRCPRGWARRGGAHNTRRRFGGTARYGYRGQRQARRHCGGVHVLLWQAHWRQAMEPFSDDSLDPLMRRRSFSFIRPSARNNRMERTRKITLTPAICHIPAVTLSMYENQDQIGIKPKICEIATTNNTALIKDNKPMPIRPVKMYGRVSRSSRLSVRGFGDLSPLSKTHAMPPRTATTTHCAKRRPTLTVAQCGGANRKP